MRALAALVLFAPALALAAPPTLGGDAGQVVITIPDAEAAGALRAAGDRIELDVAPGVAQSKTYFGSDPTVRKVEVTAGATPKISVQIRHSRGTVEALAAAARLVEGDGKLVLYIPRDRKPAVAAVEPEAPAVTVEPAAVQVKTVAAPPPEPVPVPVPVPVSAPAPPKPAITGIPSAPPPALAGIPAGSASLSSGRLLLVAAILCMCGAVAVIARRRRGAAPGGKGATANNIEVLASRALGGKTRAVLLSVNDSQMLLAVSDQGARLIGQWFAGEDGIPIADRDIAGETPLFPMATPEPAGSPDTEPQVPVGVRRPSAAVAGLIKLKREGDARFASEVGRALRAGRR